MEALAPVVSSIHLERMGLRVSSGCSVVLLEDRSLVTLPVESNEMAQTTRRARSNAGIRERWSAVKSDNDGVETMISQLLSFY